MSAGLYRLAGMGIPGGWLWAKPRSGLTLLPRGPMVPCKVTRRPDALVSSDGRPGPEQRRDLIGDRLQWRDRSQYRPTPPAPRVEVTARSKGAWVVRPLFTRRLHRISSYAS